MRELITGSIYQIRSSWRLLLAIYIPVLILFAGIGVLSAIVPHLTIPELVMDVASVGKLPFYTGAVSQLGLLFWSASTTLCFFIFYVLKKMKSPRKEALNFLLFGGLLSGYLMLDDTYMLHEEFFPDYLKLIPEEVIIFGLGVAMLAFLFFNWKELMRSEYSLMFLAFGFFGLSVALDAIPTRLYEHQYLIEKMEHLFEDGAKFAAIVTWVTFYARYGLQQIAALARQ